MIKYVRRRHALQAIGMALFAGCSSWKDSSPDLQAIDISETAWTHPFHDAANTNHVLDKDVPSGYPTNERWQMDGLASNSISSDGEEVYVVRQSQSDEILCELDRQTGESNWIFHPGNQLGRVRIGAPTISKTVIYVNIRFEQDTERKSFIYAIDRRDGSRLWRTEITSDALVRLHRSGIAIITQQSPETSSVLALDATTGDERWRIPDEKPSIPFFGNNGNDSFDRQSVPTTAISGKNLYVPIVDGDETNIGIFDITSGTVRKKFTVPVPVEFKVAFANGLLYGTSHSLIPGTTATKSVYAIDPTEERLQWYARTTDEVYQLGVSERAVYFVDDGVRCLDATSGTELWRADSEDTYPAILGNYVTSVGPGGNVLHFRDQQTGESVATLTLESTGYVNFVSSDEQSIYIMKGRSLHSFI